MDSFSRSTTQIINGKYVEGFYIYARQLDTAATPGGGGGGGGGIGVSNNGGGGGNMESYKMLTVLNGGGASTCTVTALLKYTLYEFFIVPFYKTVEGKPSNSRISRTQEDGELFFLLVFFFGIIIFYFIA